MNLLVMILMFALGVALAKHVVKIGLKIMSFSMNFAFVILLFLMVVVGALTPVILSIA